ncbi:MAG: vWA domain-containing protein [Phycisphaerales bacterium]
MLTSDDWAYRAVALMRLARFEGEGVAQLANNALSDAAWQVRCFAIATAHQQGLTIAPEQFTNEDDARVLRTAVRFGYNVPEETLNAATTRLLRMRTVDALLLGIELGAASPSEGIRADASKRTGRLIANMSPQIAAMISRRLARVLQLDRAPATLIEWQRWAASQPRDYQLPRPQLRDQAQPSLIALADAETFLQLRDYLGSLRQRDLEMVIVLDATNSMTPVIDAVKADVDALMLFLTDISSTMRLGLLAFRDHDNPGRLVEAHQFSTDLESLRNFLFGLATPGGATFPEAVLDGLAACRKFEWADAAEREIILIGDAPPHDKDGSEVRSLLEWYVQQGLSVHAVHVPMQWPNGYLASLTPTERNEREFWLSQYNINTRAVFADIALIGGGHLVELTDSSQNTLVRSIMKLTIQPDFWPYFDAFYDVYLELCR